MMQWNKKTFYAIEAVLYIAYNSVSDCISSKEIAQKQNMLPRYLEQIMQRLVKHGILKGMRGPSGGYLLAREKRRISLADICRAMSEEDIALPPTPLGDKVVGPAMKELQEKFLKQMEEVTVNDLCEQANDRSVRKTTKENNNFII